MKVHAPVVSAGRNLSPLHPVASLPDNHHTTDLVARPPAALDRSDGAEDRRGVD
jgi:hypothetical protein